MTEQQRYEDAKKSIARLVSITEELLSMAPDDHNREAWYQEVAAFLAVTKAIHTP